MADKKFTDAVEGESQKAARILAWIEKEKRYGVDDNAVNEEGKYLSRTHRIIEDVLTDQLPAILIKSLEEIKKHGGKIEAGFLAHVLNSIRLMDIEFAFALQEGQGFKATYPEQAAFLEELVKKISNENLVELPIAKGRARGQAQ